MSAAPSKLRVSVWEWVQTSLLGANLAWSTLCLGGILAETKIVSSMLLAALLAAHGAALLTDAGARVTKAAGLFLPFLIYGAANVAWVTPVRWLGWIDWLGWLQAIVVFGVVLNGIRSRPCRIVLYGVLFVLAVTQALLGAYQQFVAHDWLMLGRTQAAQYAGRASGSFGIPNSMAAFLLLVLPLSAAFALRRGATPTARVFFGWLTLVLLFGLGLTVSRGAWLGLGIAITVWPLLNERWRWGRRIAIATVVAVAGLAIAVGAFVSSATVRTRLSQLARDHGERSRPVLWRAGAGMVRERPWFGTGAASFDVEFERFRPSGFINQPIWAHNDYLNTVSDYGAVGAALLFAPILFFVVPRRRRDQEDPASETLRERPGVHVRPRRHPLDSRLVRQAHAIGLLAFALQLFVDFHFKIPALAMACAVMGALTVAAAGRRFEAAREGPPARRRTRLVASATAALAAVIVVVLLPNLRGEALRESARRRIDAIALQPATPDVDRERLAAARDELAQAVRAAPGNGAAWADTAYVLAQWSRVAPREASSLGERAEASANRALAIAPAVAEFWIRRGVARDLRGRWSDAGDDFTKAITLAPHLPMTWYYYAYHLSLRDFDVGLANEMVATCLRLDPTNAEALRLRQQLATGRPFRP